MQHPTLRSKRFFLLGLLLFLPCLHLSISTARLMAKELEFMVVDGARFATVEPRGYDFRKNGQITPFTQEPDGRFAATVEWKGHQYRVQVRMKEARVTDAWLDGAPMPARRIRYINDLIPVPMPEQALNVLRIGDSRAKRAAIATALMLVMWLSSWWLFHRIGVRRRSEGRTLRSVVTYSGSAAGALRMRDWGIIVAVLAVTAMSMLGCDAWSIYNVVRVGLDGLDPYQFQICHKAILKYEFLNFPYNPALMMFWTFFDRVWAFLFGGFGAVFGRPHLHLLLLKLVNAGALILTFLSVISFAKDRGVLRGSARLSFFVTLFNPMLFYIPVLFVQLDAIPLFFVTLGLLLAQEKNEEAILGTILFTFGIAMKVQGLILLPIATVMVIYTQVLSEGAYRRAGFRRLLLCLGAIGAVLGTFLIPFLRTDQPLQLLLSHFDQTTRFLGVVLPYAPGVYLYYAPFFVFAAYLFGVLGLRSGRSTTAATLFGFFWIGVLIAGYNLGQLYTHPTLMHLGGALAFAIAMEPNSLRKVNLSLGTTAIILMWWISEGGDLTRIIPGHDGLIQRWHQHADPTFRLQFDSLLFTLSLAGLLVYGVLFLRMASRAMPPLESEEPRAIP